MLKSLNASFQIDAMRNLLPLHFLYFVMIPKERFTPTTALNSYNIR